MIVVEPEHDMRISREDNSALRRTAIAALSYLIATLIGSAILLVFDLRDVAHSVNRKELLPAGDELVQLLGLVAVYAVALTFAALLGLGLFFMGETLARRHRQAGAVVKYWAWSLPFLPLFWFVAQSLFTGGTMQAYSYGGMGAVVVVSALLFGTAESRRLAGRLFKWRFGHLAVATLLLSIGAVLRWFDARIFPDSYLFLHQLLATVILVLVSAAVWTLISLRKQRIRGGIELVAGTVGAGVVVITLAFWHLGSFRDASPAARRLLSQELPISSRLFGILPYALRAQPMLDLNRVLAAGLSDRGSLLVDARNRACELLNRQENGPKQINVLVVSIDAVRADHLSFMGYGRDTTPFLSSLLAKSVLFSQARSPSTTSFFSIHSLLSGTYVASIAEMAGAMPTLLSTHLASHGYHSAAFFSEFIFSVRDTAWPEPDLSMGFKDVYHSEAHSDGIRKQITDYVDQLDGGPFFIFTHIMDPHAPYEKHASHDFGDGDIDRYDSELAFMDHHLGLLWADLEERGLAAKTILIVTSDHGEGFGEGRSFHHGGAPTEVQCRIPLILHAPGVIDEAMIIDAPVSNYSLPATIVDLLGLPEIEGNECPSLSPLLMKTADPKDYYSIIERPTYSHRPGVRRVRAIIDGNFKLMLDLSLDIASLYDLKADPQELNDLSEAMPEQVQRMRDLELNWRRDLIVLQSRNSLVRFPIEYATIRKLVLEGDLSRITEFAEFANDDDELISADVVEILFDADLKSRSAGQGSIFDVMPIPSVPGRTQVLTEALRFLRGEAGLDSIIEKFAAADSMTQLRLARAAGHWDFEIDHAPVLWRLLGGSQDPQVAQQLQVVLAKLGDETVIDQFLMILEKAPTSELPELLDIALSYPDDLIWARVFELKGRRDSDFRHSLATSVGKYPSPKRLDWILSMFRSSYPSYRIDGLKAAKENLGEARLRAAVFEMLRHDEDLRFKSSAISLASKCGGDDALSALHDVFGSNEAVAESCLSAIRRHVENEFRTDIAVTVKASTDLRLGVANQLTLPKLVGLPADQVRLGMVLSRAAPDDQSSLEIELVIGATRKLVVLVGQSPTVLLTVPKSDFELGACELSLAANTTGTVAVEMITAGAIVDPLYSWGSSLATASVPLVLDRFSKEWTTHNELDDGLVWLVKKKGQFSFISRSPQESQVTIGFCVACESLDARVSLNGAELGMVTLGSGLTKSSFPLKRALHEMKPNVLEIEVTKVSGERPQSVENAIGRIGLAVESILIE